MDTFSVPVASVADRTPAESDQPISGTASLADSKLNVSTADTTGLNSATTLDFTSVSLDDAPDTAAHTSQEQSSLDGDTKQAVPSTQGTTAVDVKDEPAELPASNQVVSEAAAAADDANVSSTHPASEAIVPHMHGNNFPIKVWVKDPEKVEVSRIGVAFSSYVTYLLKTECTSGSLEATQQGPADDTTSSSRGGTQVYEVRRRFADFEMLHRLLKSHHKGYFLPPLPDKAFLDSRFAGDSFLQVRKVDLQAYMCTVANHPALRDSEELRLFLTQPGDLSNCQRWQKMIQRPAPADVLLSLLSHNRQQHHNTAAAPDSGSSTGSGATGSSSSNPLGMVMRMKHSLMSVVQPKSKPELPADEQQLRQAKEWCKELQQHLSACVAAVRSLLSHLESVADDFNDLGRSFCHMARFEEQLAQRQGQYTVSGSSSTQRAADLQHLGYAALRQHTVEKQAALRTGASLVFLHDWWVLIPEVIACLEEREEALDVVHMLEEELREKQAAAAKISAALGPVASADKRLAALNASIQSLTEKWAAAQEQYTVCKERNQSELVRMNLQRAVDFRESLQRLAAIQLQLANAAADVWKNTVAQFDAQQS